jgi:hypothetical protein
MLTRHVLLPAIAPALFFAVATSPVELLGCRTRGLVAVAIALLALAGSAWAVWRVYAERRRGAQVAALLWSGTALVLMTPAVGLLALA